MSTTDILEHLRSLEVSLLQPGFRSAPARLRELLHEQFLEVGRSGRRFTRAEILADLAAEQAPAIVWSQDFCAEFVSDDVVLLRYRTAHVGGDGMLSRHTERTSLWQHVAGSWRIRFHQGTPSAAFEKTQG